MLIPVWDVGFMKSWGAALEGGACTKPWDPGRHGCPVRPLQAGGGR